MDSKILYQDDSGARILRFQTRHGRLETPFFMPVCTKATPRVIGMDDLKKIGAECFISNAFLLHSFIGDGLIHDFGGLHKFMNWDKGIFTDCGGFQMLRDGIFIKSDDSGIHFKNPSDGKKYFINPEKIMNIEMNIGSDVAMMLDNVIFYGAAKDEMKTAMDRTHLWANESLQHHTDKKQLLFGIAQGGFDKKLRKNSMEFIGNLPFDGFALGGLCIGEPKQVMYEMLHAQIPFAPKDKPRYLMGVGSPDDLLKCIETGVDVFDSIYPTETARHSTMFTRNGKLMLDKAIYKADKKPIEETCDCYTCVNHTRSYVHNITKAKEIASERLKIIHNQRFMQNLMKDAKTAIKENRFKKFKDHFLKNYEGINL